jgi:glycopeptide antibiotics resistance protein
LRLLLGISWLVFIAFAMLTPGDKFPEADFFNFQDKVIHFVCFGLLSFLWCGVGIDSKIVPKPKKRILINYLIFGILAGIILEFLQRYIPFRSFDYMDMIVNEIGGLAGLIAYLKIPIKKFSLD